jgi:hydroxymethylglutaryl-CoA synthase
MSETEGCPTTVGMDHLAVYSPDLYISTKDLALARGIDPEKYLSGIGIKEIAIPPPDEDIVTMGANAGHQLIRDADISADEIGLLIVGTESSQDRAKPVATQIHELLDISNACRVYDIMHACVAATYGVVSALDWLRNPKNKYALVIASDVAVYERHSFAEPTQGAGAVAILLCRNPRMMKMREIANYSKNVFDFWKPSGKQYPIVKGAYSGQCYVHAAEECFNTVDVDPNAAFIYHTPFPKLVEKTHSRVIAQCVAVDDAKEHFNEKVKLSLTYPSRIGNIYTGSLWLALASFLEISYLNPRSDSNQKEEFINESSKIYLFSYGSC